MSKTRTRLNVESLESRLVLSPTASLLTHVAAAPAHVISNDPIAGTPSVSRPISLPIAPVESPLPFRLPADLVLETLAVQDLGNNQFRLTATLRNGSSGPNSRFSLGDDYAGGGVWEIRRSTGGTILYGEPNGQPSLFGLADFDRGQVLATKPIPRLRYGETVVLEAVTSGRAIFSAAAVPVLDPYQRSTPLPEVNKANNSKSVNLLMRHTYPVNTFTLGLVPQLRDAIGNARVRLDSNDSYIKIPGLLDEHFPLPGKSVSVQVGWLSTPTVTYYLNDLRSTGVALSYEQGGLAVTIDFADNEHALHTPSPFAPDISVKGLQVKVFLPLRYDATYQYFLFGTPRVEVHGNWSANGPLGFAYDALLPDVNKEVSDAFRDKLNGKLDKLSYQFTKQIHDLATEGRIVGADIQQDRMILTVETPY